MKGLSKRNVQVSLGLLWLLDGLLQLQPRMFTHVFADQVLKQNLLNEPGFVRGPINFGVNLFLTHPAIFNTLFALTQLAIGCLILYKRSLRSGLMLSVFWGLIVWVFGEAYAGIFSGHALLLMGAPGPVLLYIVLALAVMPAKTNEAKQSQTAYWLVLVWAVFWAIGGVYQLLPGQNTTASLSSMIMMNKQSAPSWLSHIDNTTTDLIKDVGGSSKHIETAVQMHMSNAQMENMTSPAPVITTVNPGYWFIILLALLQMWIGFGALLPGLWRISSIYIGIFLSLVFWIVGQNLGGLYSGLATDPNTAPLFILMGLAVLGIKDLDKRLSTLGRSLQRLMIGSR